MDKKFWKAVSAEFLAMFLYIFIGIGTIITSLGYQKGGSKTSTGQAAFTIAASFGLLTTVLMHVFGQVSSAQINPAITLSLLITRRITPLRAFFYVLAQYLGAILGSAVVMITMGMNRDNFVGYTSARDPGSAFTLEMLATAFITCSYLAITHGPERNYTATSSLAYGFAVGIAHFCLVPITGCSINPARSFAPALWAIHHEVKSQWVFCTAPWAGAFAAGILWHTTVIIKDEKASVDSGAPDV